MIIFWALVIGALLGWIASILTGRTERIGCLTNIVAGEIGGFIGALLGLWLGSAFVWAILLAIGGIVLANRLFTN